MNNYGKEKLKQNWILKKRINRGIYQVRGIKIIYGNNYGKIISTIKSKIVNQYNENPTACIVHYGGFSYRKSSHFYYLWFKFGKLLRSFP